MISIPKWVKLGTNVTLGERIELGLGKPELGDLIIGDNCTIRSGTVIYRGTTIGNDCQTGHNVVIREANTLGDKVVIGSYTELAPHNQIDHHTTIHSQCFLEETKIRSNVFVAPGVKFLDDKFPIDPNPKNYKGAIVGRDSAIGGGSTILPGVIIGSRVLIGGGSVVTKNIPDGEIWFGNPAKFRGNTYEETYPGSEKVYLPGTRMRYLLK